MFRKGEKVVASYCEYQDVGSDKTAKNHNEPRERKGVSGVIGPGQFQCVHHENGNRVEQRHPGLGMSGQVAGCINIRTCLEMRNVRPNKC